MMSDEQEQAVVQPKAKASANPPAPEPSGPVIYCGPTLPRQYGLMQYSIFSSGLPANVQQLVDECPAIGALIVPVADLAQTRLELAAKGSAQAALYQQIVKTYQAPAAGKESANKVVRN